MQDGPADGSEAGSEKDADKANGEEEAVAAAIDNLSDVPSSDEEEEEVPNHCISQYTKVVAVSTLKVSFAAVDVTSLLQMPHY